MRVAQSAFSFSAKQKVAWPRLRGRCVARQPKQKVVSSAVEKKANMGANVGALGRPVLADRHNIRLEAARRHSVIRAIDRKPGLSGPADFCSPCRFYVHADVRTEALYAGV